MFILWNLVDLYLAWNHLLVIRRNKKFLGIFYLFA